jgi:hypothetical protein
MERKGLELTRENYLNLAFPEATEEEILEQEASLAEEFQLNPAHEGSSSLTQPPSAGTPDTKESSLSGHDSESELLDAMEQMRPDPTREALKKQLAGHGF